MKYDLQINAHNIRPHLDIERDIQLKKNGLFTFNLRVNQSNIEDYAQFETITIRDYEGVLYTGYKERGATYSTRKGNTENAVRPGNR
jgi:hypothetical protein